MLNCIKDGILPPDKFFLFASKDGHKWSLLQIKDTPVWKNLSHDAFVDYVSFDELKGVSGAKYLKLAFTAQQNVYLHCAPVNKR